MGSLVLRFAHAPGELPPLLPLLRTEALVLADLERADLGLQLPVALPPLGCEPAVLERRLNGAVGLVLVAAVTEAAARGQIGNLLEGRSAVLGVRVPERELAHAGRVEQQPAARPREQLAVRGGVSSAAGVLERGARREPMLAEQRG